MESTWNKTHNYYYEPHRDNNYSQSLWYDWYHGYHPFYLDQGGGAQSTQTQSGYNSNGCGSTTTGYSNGSSSTTGHVSALPQFDYSKYCQV